MFAASYRAITIKRAMRGFPISACLSGLAAGRLPGFGGGWQTQQPVDLFSSDAYFLQNIILLLCEILTMADESQA